MVMFVYCMIYYVIFIFVDIIPMYKKKEYSNLWKYLLLFGTSFVLTVLMAMEVKIPSPAKPIKEVVMYVVDFFSGNSK